MRAIIFRFMFSFTNVIHIIVIFQGTLLCLYIFTSKKPKSLADVLLGLIIGILSFQILGIFLANRKIEPEFFQTANAIYGFLYGPLLYFFSRSITRANFAIKQVDYLHFIPAFLILISLVFWGNTLSQAHIYMAYAVHILIYLSICVREVIRYKKVVKDNYSKLEWLNLGWLQSTFLIFSLIVLTDVFQFTVFLLKGDSYPLENIVYLLILAAINLLYFKGFMPERGITGINQDDLTLSSSIDSTQRRKAHALENQGLIQKLDQHLLSKQSFKNPNLTIALLSKELEIPKRTLSELINHHYQQNFVDFINTHRIESAKRRLEHPSDSKETILEVMYEVGFNSKSSFNTAFKKKTGLTPSQYKSKFR